MKYPPILALMALVNLPVFAMGAVPAPNSSAAVLAAREQRVELLRTEIKDLDARIEGRLDRIIDALTHLTDSKDSKTKVARMKEQTVESLKKNSVYYVQRRAALQEELRRPTLQLTDDQKQKLIAVLDTRIEKRVQAVLTLEKSLPTHRDYQRYESTGGGYWGTQVRVNEDFKQNQRVSTYTNQMREQVVTGLKQSIARLEQQQRTLQTQAAGAPTAALKYEIARNDMLLAERRKQLSETLSAPATEGRAISQREAIDLDQTLQAATKELSRDFTILFARYNAYLPALAQLNGARAQSVKR